MKSIIPYGRQDIDQQDIDSVVEVLKSDFITQGPKVLEFESNIAKYCGAEYALSFNSATSALHCACIALGVNHDSLVWTSPNSFVASANCALYEGAKIDFVDIDEKSYNICPSKIEDKIKKGGISPDVIVVVDYAGQPCDLKEIRDLAKKYNFRIIQDSSHAIGASYNNKKVGSCEFSDITIFSFHPVKIITTGEGGMATTNDPEIFKKLQLSRSHGVTRDKELMSDSCGKIDGWYYEQVDLGYNYRMTDIAAALGNSQLRKLDRFVKRRNEIAKIYSQAFNDMSVVVTPKIKEDRISAYHLYPILCENNDKKKSLYNFLRDNGVLVNCHYIPIHTQPYYRNLGFDWQDFPVAEDFYQREISLPLFPSLQGAEIEKVIRLIKSFF